MGSVIVAAVPLAAFVLPVPADDWYWVAGTMTPIMLFVAGAGRGLTVDGIERVRGGLEMLAVGAAAAGIAYGIGVLIPGIG